MDPRTRASVWSVPPVSESTATVPSGYFVTPSKLITIFRSAYQPVVAQPSPSCGVGVDAGVSGYRGVELDQVLRGQLADTVSRTVFKPSDFF